MKYLVGLSFFIFSQTSFADLVDYPIELENFSAIKKESVPQEFQELQKKIEDIYITEIEQHGGNLVVEYVLDSSTVNATASRVDNNWIIKFYGGLISHRKFDVDIFAAIFCHELGHHIGGSPYKFDPPSDRAWVSVEGQADYFATHQCLKKLYENEDNRSFVLENEILPVMNQACGIDDLCLRNSFISNKVGNFISSLGQGRRGRRGKKPDINEPDQSIVRQITVQHPAPQCRLDTLFQGSLCYSSRACPYTGELFSGARPLCWFAQ